jgi:hypothetical protein
VPFGTTPIIGSWLASHDPQSAFHAPCRVESTLTHTILRGRAMSLGLIAAFTGVCFAGAVAAITIGLSR